MRVLLPLLVSLIVANTAYCSSGITLARDGKPLARIVAPQSRHPVVNQAISDLHLYLGKVTGADFAKSRGSAEIRILEQLPPDAPEALRNAREGYWIDVRGKTIRIVGGSPIGAAYGVYRFLEKYVGVRWFLPAPDGEYVPKTPNLVIPPVSEFSKPAFKMRWVGGSLWGLRNGSNRLDVGEMLGPNGKLVSAGYRLEPGIYHTQESFLPMARYFNDHPEYYALVKRERKEGGHWTKLCTSNPEVIAEVARNMARYLDEHSGVQVLSLSPSDGRNFCECASCVAQDEPDVTDRTQVMSRRMVLFYNAVATEFRRTHPEARLAVGAYHAYAWPPKDESLRLAPETYAILCHYVPACLAHSVNDPGCPANRRYNTVLKDWLRRSSGVYFYEYYLKGNWLELPWPIVHTIAADIPYYQRMGIEGLYTQFSERSAYTLGLNYYIAAKLLWNPRANVRGLVDEFYEKYFAESAGPMREYFELMERRMSTVRDDIPGDAWTNATKVFDSALLDQLQAKLDGASRLAGTETTRQRVERYRLHLGYTRRLVGLLALKDRDKAAAYPLLREFIQDMGNPPAELEGIVSGPACVHFLTPRVASIARYAER